MSPSLRGLFEPLTKPSRNEVDLHMHSIHSDGADSPEELVRQALALGLRAIALTDHDSVAGLADMRRAAEGKPLEIVTGFELSASEGRSDVHILGYDPTSELEALQAELSRFREARERRALEMVSKLNGMGVEVSMADVRSLAGPGAIGRPHVAGALILKGIVNTTEEAFRKYLGHHAPAFVPKEALSLEGAFELARRHGARLVLAHPGTLRRDDLIPRLLALGLAGIEVWHPRHDESAVKRYLEATVKYGLVGTGGSDYHGSRNPGASLGCSHVPYRALEALRAA